VIVRYAATLILILLLAGAVLAADTPLIPADLVVRGDRITLADLVSAAGVTAGDHLEQIVLVKAPQPGAERILNGAYVRSQLAAAGLAYIAVPSRVRIRRPGANIDPALGLPLIEKFIAEKAPWPKGRYTISVQRRHMPITVEPGEVTPHLVQHPAGRLTGAHTYVVEYRRDGRRLARGTFVVEVGATATVYLAAHRINRGVLLADRDLMPKQVQLSDVLGLPITDKRRLIGARLKRAINEGQTIEETDLLVVPAVRRGDAVKIVCRRGEMVVTAFGVAKENGALGEVIRIENMQSKRVVHARVTDSKTVAVIF
jgi:flagellar basal body P-ring formation protein FlgA